ncbi:hypothetical protein BDW66DRAFT_124249 [Aspergillus desertorum]
MVDTRYRLINDYDLHLRHSDGADLILTESFKKRGLNQMGRFAGGHVLRCGLVRPHDTHLILSPSGTVFLANTNRDENRTPIGLMAMLRIHGPCSVSLEVFSWGNSVGAGGLKTRIFLALFSWLFRPRQASTYGGRGNGADIRRDPCLSACCCLAVSH